MRFAVVSIVMVAFLALTAIPPAGAHGTVDQANDAQVPGDPFTGAWDIVDQFPVGQEFQPSQARLSAVDLYLADVTSGDGDTTIRVEIRETSIEGPFVGVTTGVLPAGFSGWWHFHFNPFLRVQPGQIYVIRVTADGNEHWDVSWSEGPGPTYPPGVAIALDAQFPAADLFFRTYRNGKSK